MNDNCFEIGTIQAFLDGETSPDLSFKITGHLAGCENCALALANAEEENSVVFSALDREYNAMVPTQRLWSSINNAISFEKAHTSFWDKVRNSLTILLANPSLTVAASVLIVFAIFAAVWNLKPTTSATIEGPIAVNREVIQTPVMSAQTVDIIAGADVVAPSAGAGNGYKVEETHLSDDKVARLARTIAYKPSAERVRIEPTIDRGPASSAETFLPGEESYVRTIADLKQNVEGQKDRVMNPASRVTYERDMAVVNDAITKMKKVVKNDPKNQSAKQVLYSSYQNKIDLLNSVVEREELMASLTR